MSAPNSNNFAINGNDTAGCGATTTGPALPAVGVTDNPDVTTVIGDIPNNRKSNYTGSGGSTPDVENISASLPANLQSVSSFQSLVSTLKADVTQPVITGPASSISNPGSLASPQIIYVNVWRPQFERQCHWVRNPSCDGDTDNGRQCRVEWPRFGYRQRKLRRERWR